MEFPLTIEIADKPVATKNYRTVIGRRPVTEALYIIDDPIRFVYYHIRISYKKSGRERGRIFASSICRKNKKRY